MKLAWREEFLGGTSLLSIFCFSFFPLYQQPQTGLTFSSASRTLMSSIVPQSLSGRKCWTTHLKVFTCVFKNVKGRAETLLSRHPIPPCDKEGNKGSGRSKNSLGAAVPNTLTLGSPGALLQTRTHWLRLRPAPSESLKMKKHTAGVSEARPSNVQPTLGATDLCTRS